MVIIILMVVLLQVYISIENAAATKATRRLAKYSSVVGLPVNIWFAVLPLIRSTQIIDDLRKISGGLQQLLVINTSMVYKYFYGSTWITQFMFESAKSVSLYSAFVLQFNHKYCWRLGVNSPKITDKILTDYLVPQRDSSVDIDVDWNKIYLPESNESLAYKKFSAISILSLLLSTNYPLRAINEVANGTWLFLSTYLEMALIRTVGKVPLSSPLKAERVLSPNVALLSFVSTGQVERCPVIMLDPGHGGTDPGAIGVSGVFEKHLTLAMAVELREKLLATGRYRVVLTRENDIFIALRERVASARAHGADLFISLHANAITTSKTRGLSIYTLSETASDHEAEALADRENKADLIGGVDLSNESSDVANILIDLVQRETMNHSAQLASVFIHELQREVYLLPKAHRFAGFAVLKAPDVPAVLLEIGYLSNPEEEQLLHQSIYRAKLSSTLVRAIDHYFKRHKLTS